MRASRRVGLSAIVCLYAGAAAPHAYASLNPAYEPNYDEVILGALGGVITFDGLAFLPSNSTSMLYAAGTTIYSTNVVRGAGNHITGFSGSPTTYATSPGNIGDMILGPNRDVLFVSTGLKIAQFKLGSATPDKVVDLAGVGGPSGATIGTTGFFSEIAFNPKDPSKLQLQFFLNGSGYFYEVPLTPDGSGTYNISGPTFDTFYGRLDSLDYAQPFMPVFPDPALIVGGALGAHVYTVDAAGHPVVSGAGDSLNNTSTGNTAFDPVTLDLMYTQNGSATPVHAIQLVVPEPSSAMLLGVAGVLMSARRRRVGRD